MSETFTGSQEGGSAAPSVDSPQLRDSDRRELVAERDKLASKQKGLREDFGRLAQRIEELDGEQDALVQQITPMKVQLDALQAKASEVAQRRVIVGDQQAKIEREDEAVKARLAEIEALMPRRSRDLPVPTAAGKVADDQILAAAERFGTFSPKDLAAFLKINVPSVRSALRRFAEQGVVRDTGTKFAGQPMFEHLGAKKIEAEEEALSLRLVRDFVTVQKQPFTEQQITADTEVAGKELTDALQYLMQREVIASVGFDDLSLYEYKRPSGAGEAATRDAERRKREGAAKPSTRGGPVAGTGQSMRITDPDVRALVAAIEAADGHVQQTASGHYEVTADDSRKRVLIACTPSSRRTVMNDRARVRRELGLKV